MTVIAPQSWEGWRVRLAIVLLVMGILLLTLLATGTIGDLYEHPAHTQPQPSSIYNTAIIVN